MARISSVLEPEKIASLYVKAPRALKGVLLPSSQGCKRQPSLETHHFGVTLNCPWLQSSVVPQGHRKFLYVMQPRKLCRRCDVDLRPSGGRCTFQR